MFCFVLVVIFICYKLKLVNVFCLDDLCINFDDLYLVKLVVLCLCNYYV